MPVQSFLPQKFHLVEACSLKMGYWLDLPNLLPMASWFWFTTWPLAISSPLGINISAFTYCSPHLGVTFGSSSNMQKISAFCNFSSYRSFCGVFSTPSSTVSLNPAQGLSFWCRDALNKLYLALLSFCSHSSSVSAQYVALWMTWLLSQTFFATMTGPISMPRPRYLPSLKWSLGYCAILS